MTSAPLHSSAACKTQSTVHSPIDRPDAKPVTLPVPTQIPVRQYSGRQWQAANPQESFFSSFFTIMHDKMLECRDVLVRNFVHFKRRDPLIAQTFGQGIENDGNSCYMIAALQAIRFTQIRTKLSAPETASQKESQAKLFDILDTLEGRNGKPKETVSHTKMKEFKTKMIQKGFQAESVTSQEDAALFVQFLLDEIGVPLCYLKTEVHHGLDLPIPSFDKGIESQNQLHLSIALAPNGTELKDLVIANFVQEEIEARNIKLKDLEPSQVESYLKKLEEFNPRGSLETLQSTYISEKKIPWLLPIVLKRYDYDVHTEQGTKKTTKIIPSETVFFPLVEDVNKKAKYALRSVIIHEGRSVRGGHCYLYVFKALPDENTWIEYNNNLVFAHKNVRTVKKDPWSTPYEDVCENGYVYFYEFDSIV